LKLNFWVDDQDDSTRIPLTLPTIPFLDSCRVAEDSGVGRLESTSKYFGLITR
jgi:hypothetical protein